MKKILLILAQDDQSLSAELMNRYKTTATNAGNEVKEIRLLDLDFDPILRGGYRSEQALEPALVNSQADILWADEIVFFFPLWWYAVPAILKGFMDRVLRSGFAFKYREGKPLPEKLLVGKSAKLVVLSGGPAWFYAVSGNPAIKMMKTSLKFCGISPVKSLQIGDMSKKPDDKRMAQIFGRIDAFLK